MPLLKTIQNIAVGSFKQDCYHGAKVVCLRMPKSCGILFKVITCMQSTLHLHVDTYMLTQFQLGRMSQILRVLSLLQAW